MKGNIQEARKRLGMTQRDVADKLGKPSRTYGAWERGERELNLEDAWNIALLFGVSLDYLAGLITYEEELERNRKMEIAKLFEALNSQGQEKVIEFCRDMRGNPSYVKGEQNKEGTAE